MPSGGHARSGTLPDPNALRRDRPSDAATWRHLPSAGRPGEPPPWPLLLPTDREAELWAAHWRKPQAIVWEANGQHHEVALFVRAFADAERPRAPTASRLLARQMIDSLGLSVGGLRSHRWVIDPPDAAEAPRKHDRRSTAARSRFQSIEGGAA